MSYYTTPWEFYSVMQNIGLNTFESQVNDGQPYIFNIPNTPTNSTEYSSWIIWLDSRMQPSWADIQPGGSAFARYDAAYQALPPPRTEAEGVAGVLHGEVQAVPAQVQSDWLASSGLGAILHKPSIPAAQVQTDWTASSGLGVVLHKPSLATVATSGAYSDLTGTPVIDKIYEGTSLRTGAVGIFKTATVSSGTAVFNLTSDGTSTGTSLFPTGVIMDSVNATVNDATASYQMAWAFSNSNKTLTVTANKLSTANILTGVLGQVAANTAVVKLSVWGY